MKDREDRRSPVYTSEIMEQDEIADEESRGRSRGRRRTAKEIAQMFEQLKQRHITRKKEWQMEKEELLKQAALADESKRILVDLKKILEELRVELRSEEKKRADAQSDHERMREIWDAEKDELLRIIRNLESHTSHNQHQRQSSSHEIDSLKHQLATHERHLTNMELSNAELRIKMREQQRIFDEEKAKVVETHDGERRNWDKARQVMLEKIEALQEESRQLQSGAFPLHGSHVVSPVTDDQIYLTSPVSEERSSANDEKTTRQSTCEGSDHHQNLAESNPKSQGETKYNHFQKTVDEALKQIEKISLDLNTMEVDEEAKDGRRSKEESRAKPLSCNVTKPSVTSYSSPRASSRDRRQMSPHVASHSPSPFGSQRTAPKERNVSLTSQGDDDVAGCSRQSDWRGTKSVTSQDAGDKMRGRANSCKLSETKDTSKLPQRRTSLNQTAHHVTSDVDSPLISTPTTSCSIPVFTESGTDSASIVTAGSPLKRENAQIARVKRSELPTRSDVKRRPNNSPTDFVKVEKRYSTPRDYKPGSSASDKTSAKKLPNLHQKLLFHNTDKSSNDLQSTALSSTRKQSQDDDPQQDKKGFVHTPYFDPEKGYIKNSSKFPSSPRMQHRQATSTKSSSDEILGAPRNLPENDISRSSSQDAPDDFVGETGGFPSINVEEVPPPPVRPKPSITIEKDASGNVLRVITDPRFQRQGSPLASGGSEIDSTAAPATSASRRRRSSGNIKEAATCHSPLGRNVEALTSVKPDEAAVSSRLGKTGKDKGGKNWIKKKLSFLDTPKDAVEKDGGKSPERKNGSKSRGERTRSSSLRRGDKDRRLSSSSEDSLEEQVDKSKSRNKRKGKKGNSPNAEEREVKKEPKSRMRRYTRSKTDTSLEMKNLFSRFRQSQFNQKKPSIVKHFERKLLENEIKALEDKNAEETASPISEGKSSRGSQKVREGKEFEDGYSGEDELEREASPGLEDESKATALVTTTASLTLSRASAITSSQSDIRRRSMPSVRPKPRHHTSMVDLRWTNDRILEESSGSPDVRIRQKSVEQESPINTTPTSEENQSVSTLVGKFNTTKKSEENFIRGAPGRFSLKQEQIRKFRRNVEGLEAPTSSRKMTTEPKRLSWVSGTREGDYPAVTWREKVTAKEEEKTPGKSSMGNPPGRRRMSEDMLKKKLNLEKILSDGPKTPRSRRYKRSETQPIESTRRSDEEEEDCDFDGDVRGGISGFWDRSSSSAISRSRSLRELSEETHQPDITPPSLTSRFKKPTPNNRRPSRWQRKNEH